MLTKSELFDTLNGMIAEDSLELFDLELPNGAKGVVRVFLCHKGGNCEGITHEACSKVSRKINFEPRFESIRERYSLEVSSPGVNRKLRTESHFANAVGERLKFTADVADATLNAAEGQEVESSLADLAKGGRGTFIGTLTSFADKTLTVTLESPAGHTLELPFSAVRKARVDFLF